MKRYPLQNLIDALAIPGGEVARRLGMGATQLRRAREQGLSERQADLYAVRAGFVPWLVWPDWIDDVIESVSIECEDSKCDARFVPTRKGHRFCSEGCQKRCADRSYKARRRQDPEFREVERARLAEYRTERQREIGRAQRRAYYQANREAELARQREYDRTVRAARRTAA